MNGLRRLLTGSACNELQSENPDNMQLLSTGDKAIENLFVKPVVQQLTSDNKVAALFAGRSVRWEATGKVSDDEFKKVFSQAWDLVRYALYILQSVLPTNSTGSPMYWLFRFAGRMRESAHNHKRSRTYPHDTISIGSVVEALVLPGCLKRADQLVLPTKIESSVHLLFAVVGILKRNGDERVWAVVLPCSGSDDRILQVTGANLLETQGTNKEVRLLRLDGSARRVATFHACGKVRFDGCTFDERKKMITHAKTVLQGGLYYFTTRLGGYPRIAANGMSRR